MNGRYLMTAAVFLAIVFWPYWIYLPMLLLAIIFFPFFWEGLLLAFLIDIIHASGEISLFLVSPFALGAFILLIVLLPVRVRLRNHA